MIFAKRSLLNIAVAFVVGIALVTWLATANPIGAQNALAQMTAQSGSTALSSLEADHIILRVPNFSRGQA